MATSPEHSDAFLYGAGAQKIGSIVLPLGAPEEQKAIGKKLMQSFLKKTPGIKKLRDAIQKVLVESSEWVGKEQKIKWKRRHLIGLDGRKLHIRSPHSAPNTLLQSAGALICKKWLVQTERRLTALGLKHGWDGDFAYMAWVHDEIQVACRTPEIAEIVARESQEAMRDTQEFFQFKVRLDTEAKVGSSWFECH
nr:DNA polymerase [Pseudomonas sp. HMWF032]